MYEVCERLHVWYTFGLSANAVLQRQIEGLLAEAVDTYERERQEARQQDTPGPALPSRLFTGFWYQAGTWPAGCRLLHGLVASGLQAGRGVRRFQQP